jgi:Transposase
VATRKYDRPRVLAHRRPSGHIEREVTYDRRNRHPQRHPRRRGRRRQWPAGGRRRRAEYRAGFRPARRHVHRPPRAAGGDRRLRQLWPRRCGAPGLVLAVWPAGSGGRGAHLDDVTRTARPARQSKTDPVDALAIARITTREQQLPPVRLTVGAAADLRALLDYREDLVRERGALVNRAHAELGGCDPATSSRSRS